MPRFVFPPKGSHVYGIDTRDIRVGDTVGVGRMEDGTAHHTGIVRVVTQEPDGSRRRFYIESKFPYPSSSGPWIDIGQDTLAAKDVSALMQTSKTGLLSKVGPDPQGHVASFLTGLKDRRSLGAHLSNEAAKMGRPGVKGARRKTRGRRKTRKTRKH